MTGDPERKPWPSPQDVQNEQPPATLAEVAEFMGSVSPDVKCPICRNDSFEVVVKAPEGSPIIPIKNRPDPIPNAFIELFGVTCNKCGHLMLFTTLAFSKWKQSHGRR